MQGAYAPLKVFQLLRGERTHLAAGRAALVAHLEERGQFIQRKPDREGVLDESYARQRFGRVLAITI
jgi:hypothetical protein